MTVFGISHLNSMDTLSRLYFCVENRQYDIDICTTDLHSFIVSLLLKYPDTSMNIASSGKTFRFFEASEFVEVPDVVRS